MLAVVTVIVKCATLPSGSITTYGLAGRPSTVIFLMMRSGLGVCRFGALAPAAGAATRADAATTITAISRAR